MKTFDDLANYIDGKKVGEGEIGATLAVVFSADDGCDVGEDSGAPVSPDYKAGNNRFNGRVKGVLLSIAEDDGKHQIDPMDAVRVALARQ
jgi:arylsulfatase